MRACPTSRRECLLYGSPEEVQRAEDPLAPVGGWSFDRVELPQVREDVGFRVVSTTEGTGQARHARATVEAARLPGPEPRHTIYRVWLDVGGPRELAFTTGFRTYQVLEAPEPPPLHAQLLHRAGRLFVYMGDGLLGAAISIHDPRTGARDGLPRVGRFTPYFPVYLDGEDGPFVVPTWHGDTLQVGLLQVGLLHGDGSQRGLLVARPGEQGRVVRFDLSGERPEPVVAVADGAQTRRAL
jgi:hypothetical protein